MTTAAAPAPLAAPPAFRLGTLALAPLTREQATEWVAGKAARREGCVVVTSNINHLQLAEKDPRFSEIVGRSELNVADGWPLVLASRLLRHPLPARVAGVDLVADVLATADRLRLAILGGPAGTAAELGRRVADRHDVVLVDPLPPGTWDGPVGMEALRRKLVAADATLVLIGIGVPRQEYLAEALRAAASGPIVCCGATIEFLAGFRRRAPVWLQRLGLEWAFRMALEPRRLAGRYARAAACFAAVMFRELRRKR